ncbi:YkgJ family cysteine cluster protein [Nitrososphaera sp.]|uniref:YkgJ family cysteine cluster protein n=1 Tax=Nitrososphaera sp. TaxID=1971748 RepID=UPI002ED9D2BB
MAVHTGKPAVKFSCVEGCSDCCIYRDYYPTKEFGKIGVLLLPEEKHRIENLAEQKGISAKIVPRLAVGVDAPEKIIAYQMMGKNDGDFCPFLDVEKQSPHGGYACSIYKDRPLACAAYPVIDAGRVATLDPHCQFCKKHSTTASLDGIQGELESLSKIKAQVRAGAMRVWRYATATGKESVYQEGWVLET